jgi:hypothetical protein
MNVLHEEPINAFFLQPDNPRSAQPPSESVHLDRHNLSRSAYVIRNRMLRE